MPVYSLPSPDSPGYEAGAELLALLAWPDPRDDTQRVASSDALCVVAIRTMAELDKNFGQHLQPIRPRYVLREPAKIEADLRRLRRISGDRMAAAKMAIPFFQQAEGMAPRLPDGVNRLSLNQLAPLTLVDLGRECAHNVERDVFRPSIPVIHLAVAIAVVSNEIERAGGEPIIFADVMFNRPLLEIIVREAEACEDYLPKIKQFNIDPATVVRIRWPEIVGSNIRCAS